MLVHLSCSVIGIGQNKVTPAGVNDNQTVLSILDVSDVRNPRVLSSISLQSFSNKNNHVIFSKGYAYTTTSGGLYINNLSTPQNLKVVATVELPGTINQVRLYQNYLYVGSSHGCTRWAYRIHTNQLSSGQAVLNHMKTCQWGTSISTTPMLM